MLRDENGAYFGLTEDQILGLPKQLIDFKDNPYYV
jgi:hypothetical protein